MLTLLIVLESIEPALAHGETILIYCLFFLSFVHSQFCVVVLIHALFKLLGFVNIT